MDTNVIVAIVSGVGTILAGLVAFAGTKKSSLAEAEKDFRNTVLEENKTLRTRIDNLEDEVTALTRRNIMLESALIKAGLVPDPPKPPNEEAG